MRMEQPIPPRNGEGDRAQRGGGGSRPSQRPVVNLARKLLKSSSMPERLPWQQLRLRPGGFKFRRQHPIGPYIVDFACLSHRFAVEIDGHSHDTGTAPLRDMVREKYIRENGFRVMRVAVARVLTDAVGTADAIAALLASPLHQPSAGPPPRNGEEL